MTCECKVCNKSFKNERGLHLHIPKTHKIPLAEYYVNIYQRRDKLTNELLEFKNPKINSTKKTNLFEPGFTHISLTVKNLDELYIRLKNSNIEFNSQPTISPNGSLKVVFCKDFEGNYLELIEEI